MLYSWGRLLALATNNILGWKGLPGTETLAYYKNSYITDVKFYTTLGPGPNVIKLFTAVIYEFSH